MLRETNILVNRPHGGEVDEVVGRGAWWRRGMRLEAIIAAGWKPARRWAPGTLPAATSD
jgi:hypothetical protein